MNPLIAALLQGQQETGQSPFMAQQPQEAPPIEVAGDSFPQSKYREGIIKGGPLRLGSTGGNILGALGDAFLVQAGHAPRYAPRLREARMAEAMENYTTDPLEAIQRLGAIDPKMAAELQNQRLDNERQQAVTDATIMSRQDDYEGNTHSRAGALIGAATESTYPAMRKRYYDYYNARGIEPLFELPENYDIDALSSLAQGYIDPTKQATLESQAAYRAALIEQRGEAEEGRNARHSAGLRVRQAEGDANRSVRVEEGNRNRQVRKDLANSKNRPRPAIKFGTRPDGTRFVQR